MTGRRNQTIVFRDGRWWFLCPRRRTGLDLGPLLPLAGWRVGSLCRLIRVSRRGLERVAKESLEITPKEWLRRERILRAARLLREDRPVTEVAAELGFRHAADFTAEFRYWYGVAPRTWCLNERRRLPGGVSA